MFFGVQKEFLSSSPLKIEHARKSHHFLGHFRENSIMNIPEKMRISFKTLRWNKGIFTLIFSSYIKDDILTSTVDTVDG